MHILDPTPYPWPSDHPAAMTLCPSGRLRKERIISWVKLLKMREFVGLGLPPSGSIFVSNPAVL
eukprot:1342659-Amorphochlora_amoeboformis.AAC.1